jgi:hypothetical protein
MLKFLPLAVAISVLPLSNKISNKPFITDNGADLSFFNFKYTSAYNPFEPEKKTAEPWSQNWMATAQENIRKSEYHFTWEEKLQAYCTPNRKNNLRFFYNEKGFSVEPKTTKIPIGEFDPMAMPDKIKYKNIPNWKIKFNLNKKQLHHGKWQIVNNTAEYITDNITVQYINNDEGMRQNFIVHKPLTANNELKINFNINTKLKTKLNGNQLQFFHKKTNVLNYKDLKVWDARGKTLDAAFKKSGNGKYCIQVNTKNAVYPITIDPISTTPAAILESNQPNANMGIGVSSAGDVNGDGYSDVIAGAFLFDNDQSSEGAVFVYHGSATGISITPAIILESNLASAFLGYSVAPAGDVNGDGYSDVIAGAYGYNNGHANEGAAYVYHGSATGIAATPAVILESNQVNAQMGISVASAGDVNGDGYSDVIAGASGYDSPETDEGAAFIYHGSATGISATVAASVESNQASAAFGRSVSSAGDVNGDGFSDVIVGAPSFDSGETNEGAAFIYHGSLTGINTTAAATVESNQASAEMGFSATMAGDVNGDGYSDVIVGATRYDSGQTDEGAAFLYHGSAAGINPALAALLQSDQANAWMGIVSSAGDVNGDGYGDVIVGAYFYDNGQTNEGAAFVYHGSTTGIITTAVTTVESNQANANMGIVSSAGDVNGDGYSDIIVGAYSYDGGQNDEGAAFVYHGSAAGINTTATASVESNQASAWLGYSVAGAGDINGDGYGDVMVGVPLYNSGQTDEGVVFIYHGSATGINPVAAALLQRDQALAQLGIAVAGAGDVNGDGYSDIIVGAFLYDNGESNEGAAFIYYGSASGINTTTFALLQSNQPGAQLGISVAGGGDINGDGYSDVIAGANFYDNGHTDEGRIFIYHGSATGINTTAAAFAESNQPNAQLGYSVANAGDVNGDAFSDVIAGAIYYDNGQNDEGGAFVYHGSVSGLVTTSPASSIESNDAGAQLGSSVAGAGNVNGDAYGDVIVGAHAYDNGEPDEGAAFIYHGSAAGINIIPVTTIEGNQISAFMGWSTAGAGDVNGDGYGDVVAGVIFYENGQSAEGGFGVYHGSPSGIIPTPAAFIESNLFGSQLGVSVACAGDVNGDGYSDVIAGAFLYNGGLTDEGAAFVYHGNSPGNNKRNNLRLYNTDLTTPINSSNFLFGNFGAGLYAKSFLGRDSAKLVWETRLNYNAYSGTPITNSTFFTAQQAGYTNLGLTGIELKNLVAKLLGGRYTKLRARVKYKLTKAITGQVYGPWRNVSNIIDANNLGILPIELISFNAAWVQKGKSARLDFKTDKESGVCCFDIEKSSDGFNYYRIGTLPAKNISGIQSYSFIDANAMGKKQFYRIKIKGIAGQTDYSNIQQLQNDKTTEILVFPNPTTDVLQLQLNAAYNKMDVRVFNASGQLVKQMQVPASNQLVTIPVQNLAAGKYWLHLQSGGDRQVLQFVKQ